MEFGNKINNEVILDLQQMIPRIIKKLRLLISCCTLCESACQQHPLLCQYCQTDLPCFKQDLIGFDLLLWPAINQLLPKTSFDHLLCLAP